MLKTVVITEITIREFLPLRIFGIRISDLPFFKKLCKKVLPKNLSSLRTNLTYIFAAIMNDIIQNVDRFFFLLYLRKNLSVVKFLLQF